MRLMVQMTMMMWNTAHLPPLNCKLLRVVLIKALKIIGTIFRTFIVLNDLAISTSRRTSGAEEEKS